VLDQQFTPGHIRAVDRVLVARRVQEFGQKMPALSKNTQQLREALREAPLAFPAEPSYGKWNHFLVPVRFPSKMKRESGRRFLLRRRVDTSPLFQNCARNALRFGYAGDCPKAQFVADTICTVPNHAWLSGQEIAYVGESLRLSAEQL
jgi:dTDP-4-amino-4,6-dideoxygalactose transaminase